MTSNLKNRVKRLEEARGPVGTMVLGNDFPVECFRGMEVSATFSEDVPRVLIFCLIHNSYSVTMSQKPSLIKYD